MSLTSLNYILFLLASAAVFYLVPERFRSHLIFLVSIGFYLFFSPQKLLLLMAYILLVYGLGEAIAKFEKYSRYLTLAGIASSVFLLIFFRVLTSIKAGDLTPLGLSYCVLQSISYLRGVKEKKFEPEKSPVDLFAYLLFFPKIMAGPVEEPGKFFESLRNASFSKKNIYRALPLIAIGMAKKLAVAEVLTPAVTVTFDTFTSGSGLATLIGIICYSFVILFDFSGYTDIAMGSALLFGIELTENFKNPYLAIGMVDFWKRWHISLTDWLRTNIYFSLGGSRGSKKERYLNVLTIFLVSGLWHGTTLSYLAWGMYHGLLQIGELALMEKTGIRRDYSNVPKVLKPLIGLLTFILATIGWVMFRSADLESAAVVYSGIFTPWTSPVNALSALGITFATLIFAVFSIIVTTLLKSVIMKSDLSLPLSVLISAAGLLLALFGAILMGSSTESSFIYFNF